MINKRSLWFLTLFSLILVLSVYYITMPSELLMQTSFTNKKEKEEVSVEEDKKENAELVALRVESEEKMLDKITELKKVLTDSKANTEEKNKAFEELQTLNKNKSQEEEIEAKIQKEFNLKSFVSIEGVKVTVVVDSKDEGKQMANKIMRCVQQSFDNQMSITVKFQK